MPNRFAQGKKAFGFCARCNQRYDLAKLKPQIIKQKVTNLRVCPECLDVDQPQLMLGTFPIDDPQALRDPRPDPSLAASRDMSIALTTDTWWYLLTETGDYIISEQS